MPDSYANVCQERFQEHFTIHNPSPNPGHKKISILIQNLQVFLSKVSGAPLLAEVFVYPDINPVKVSVYDQLIIRKVIKTDKSAIWKHPLLLSLEPGFIGNNAPQVVIVYQASEMYLSMAIIAYSRQEL
jgi:hypothetical protein